MSKHFNCTLSKVGQTLRCLTSQAGKNISATKVHPNVWCAGIYGVAFLIAMAINAHYRGYQRFHFNPVTQEVEIITDYRPPNDSELPLDFPRN